MKMKITFESKVPKRSVGFNLTREEFEQLEHLAEKSRTTPTTIARVIVETALAQGIEIEQ